MPSKLRRTSRRATGTATQSFLELTSAEIFRHCLTAAIEGKDNRPIPNGPIYITWVDGGGWTRNLWTYRFSFAAACPAALIGNPNFWATDRPLLALLVAPVSPAYDQSGMSSCPEVATIRTLVLRGASNLPVLYCAHLHCRRSLEVGTVAPSPTQKPLVVAFAFACTAEQGKGMALDLSGSCPHTGHLTATVGAAPAIQARGSYGQSPSPNKQRPPLRTVGILQSVAQHVAEIHELQASLLPNPPSSLQGFASIMWTPPCGAG